MFYRFFIILRFVNTNQYLIHSVNLFVISWQKRLFIFSVCLWVKSVAYKQFYCIVYCKVLYVSLKVAPLLYYCLLYFQKCYNSCMAAQTTGNCPLLGFLFSLFGLFSLSMTLYSGPCCAINMFSLPGCSRCQFPPDYFLASFSYFLPYFHNR